MLTKRMTIRFSPKLSKQLQRVARKEGTSIGHLVRQAAIHCCLLPDPQTRPYGLKVLSSTWSCHSWRTASSRSTRAFSASCSALSAFTPAAKKAR